MWESLRLLSLDIGLPIAVGYLLRKGTLRHRAVWTRVFDRLIDLNVLLLVSALSLLTFWSLKLEATLLLLPLLAGAVNQCSGAVGFRRAARLYADAPGSRGAYGMACLLSNRNTAGAIAVFILFGEGGYALSRLFTCLNWVYVFLAYPVAAAYSPRARAGAVPGNRLLAIGRGLFHWRQIGLLAMAAGVALQWHGVDRPEACAAWTPWLVRLSAWGFLLPVGYDLEIRRVRSVRHDWLFLSMVKFIVAPAAGAALAWACGFRGWQLYTLVTLSASPVAIQAVAITRMFSLDLPLVMGAFLITQSLFLFLILPLLSALFSPIASIP